MCVCLGEGRCHFQETLTHQQDPSAFPAPPAPSSLLSASVTLPENCPGRAWSLVLPWRDRVQCQEFCPKSFSRLQEICVCSKWAPLFSRTHSEPPRGLGHEGWHTLQPLSHLIDLFSRCPRPTHPLHLQIFPLRAQRLSRTEGRKGRGFTINNKPSVKKAARRLKCREAEWAGSGVIR